MAALTLAADIAFQLDGDARAASALIDQALDGAVGVEARLVLADHLLELGRAAEALAIVEGRLLDFPEDEEGQRVYAGALELAHRRIVAREAVTDDCPCWSSRSWSDCCRGAEQRALERFTDRSRLDRLHDAVGRFSATAPDVRARIEAHVNQWLRDAEPFALDGSAREGLVQAATEHAWLVTGEHEEDDDDCPLALFASSAEARRRRAGQPRDACAGHRPPAPGAPSFQRRRGHNTRT